MITRWRPGPLHRRGVKLVIYDHADIAPPWETAGLLAVADLPGERTAV